MARLPSDGAFSADNTPISGDFGWPNLAFTVAPHLQIINYRGRFSRFVGI
jgi:hypothetical protein